jgi:hypothetical protein
MADQDNNDAERRARVKQLRLMENETTDALALRLMRDIISELEAEISAGRASHLVGALPLDRPSPALRG